MLDPVLKASSGAALLDAAGTRLLIERLIPLADVVTPNVDEAAVITGLKVQDLDEMKVASAKLHEMGASAVVTTGGHLKKAIDLLSFTTAHGIEQEVFKPSASDPTRPTAPGAPSPRPWPATWPWTVAWPKPPCWPKPTSLPPSPTGIRWAAEPGRAPSLQDEPAEARRRIIKYEYNSLFDKFWLEGGEIPCEVARQPFGRIAIANADAGAYAYTDGAIDQAWRAVGEILKG